MQLSELYRQGYIDKPYFLLPELVLSDRGLNAALEKGNIKIIPLEDNQIQPASLDIRIGSVDIFDEDVRIKAALQMELSNKNECLDNIKNFAKHFQGKTSFDLAPNSFTEITSLEEIFFNPKEYTLSFELRSSRGRLGIFPERNFDIKDNHMVVSVWNRNPNTIRLYTETSFFQLFFHPNKNEDGHLIYDEEEAKTLAGKCVEGSFNLLGPYIVFYLNDSILKFKKNLGIIDTKQKYPDDYLYRKIELSGKTSLEKAQLMPNETIIAPLVPRLNLPDDVGIRLLSRLPFCEAAHRYLFKEVGFRSDNYQVNACWVDPRYNGNVTAHPFRNVFPLILEKGMPIVLGVFYKYNKPVLRGYGSKDLNSHYQNSKGDSSKD